MQEVAQGRVWSGREALKRGLVDALGGVHAAVQVRFRGLCAMELCMQMVRTEHKAVAGITCTRRRDDLDTPGHASHTSCHAYFLCPQLAKAAAGIKPDEKVTVIDIGRAKSSPLALLTGEFAACNSLGVM